MVKQLIVRRQALIYNWLLIELICYEKQRIVPQKEAGPGAAKRIGGCFQFGDLEILINIKDHRGNSEIFKHDEIFGDIGLYSVL